MPTYDPDEPLDDAIRSVFPRADPDGVRKLLGEARAGDGQPLDDRVRLACVLLSEGDIGKLRHFLAEAALDSRDVQDWAFSYDDAPPPHMRRHLRR